MLLLFALFLLLNWIVTYKVLKNTSCKKEQKIIKLLIIWVIPIIGAVVVYIFLNIEKK